MWAPQRRLPKRTYAAANDERAWITSGWSPDYRAYGLGVSALAFGHVNELGLQRLRDGNAGAAVRRENMPHLGHADDVVVQRCRDARAVGLDDVQNNQALPSVR
jgi:hypothetical protein